MLLVPHSHLFTPNGRWLGNGNTIRNGVVPNVRVETAVNAKPGSDEDDMVRAAIKLIKEKNK